MHQYPYYRVAKKKRERERERKNTKRDNSQKLSKQGKGNTHSNPEGAMSII